MKKNVGRLLVFYSISEKMKFFWRNGKE
ncbi:hypothetical protein CN299_11685 [Bacillus thuringiensis]|nr:hypothetical protein CN299_11685 [Bacillus thuringiensis]